MTREDLKNFLSNEQYSLFKSEVEEIMNAIDRYVEFKTTDNE